MSDWRKRVIEIKLSDATDVEKAKQLSHLLNTQTTICAIPWTHLHAGTNGAIRLCCVAGDDNRYNITRDDGSIYKLYDPDFSDFSDSKSMQAIREQMLEDKTPMACQKCFHLENAGISSRRVYMNGLYAKDLDFDNMHVSGTIRNMDIRFGNKCNLACRMCGSPSSSTWVNEKIKYKNLYKKIVNADYSPARNETWPETPGIIDGLMKYAKDLDEIYFVGGEPFMHPQHKEFLLRLIESGDAHKIRVKYNTNGTQDLAEYPELWKHFRQVRITISIDAFGPLNEYIRYPCKWEDIDQSIKFLVNLRDNTDLNLLVYSQTTLQIYNVLSLNQLVDYLYGSGIKNILVEPLITSPWFSIEHLPLDLKKIATERLAVIIMNYPFLARAITGCVNHMNAPANETLWEKFIVETAKLDLFRNESLEAVVPEFKGYLDE